MGSVRCFLTNTIDLAVMFCVQSGSSVLSECCDCDREIKQQKYDKKEITRQDISLTLRSHLILICYMS